MNKIAIRAAFLAVLSVWVSPTLQSVRLRIDHEVWHTLRVVMLKDHIVCYLDGKKHLDAHDGTFKAQGRVGLWAKSDAKTRFDDLKVRIPAGD